MRIVNDTGGFRSHLHLLGIRIRLLQNLSMLTTNLKLIDLTGDQTGDKKFPHPAAATHTHLVNTAIPTVKIANNAYSLRIGRPHRKAHTADPIHFSHMGTKQTIFLEVIPLTYQVQIHIPQHGAEAIGILLLPLMTLAIVEFEAIGSIEIPFSNTAGKKIRAFDPRHHARSSAKAKQPRLADIRSQAAHHHSAVGMGMTPQHRKRIVTACLNHGIGFGIQCGHKNLQNIGKSCRIIANPHPIGQRSS